MRWHLLTTFDAIYILDLHGNAKKKETCPDGSPDQNVFDIQQGVSINLFVKTGKQKRNQFAAVYHYDLFGERETKYDFLWQRDTHSIEFTPLHPSAPQYFFVRKDFAAQQHYEKGFSVNEAFLVNSVGIVTARDEFTIHATPEQVQRTLREFLSLEDEAARKRFNLGNDVRDWKVRYAREDLLRTGPDFARITQISYRPFDRRFTYYTGKSKGFHCMPRGEVMQHFLKDENIGLIVSRQAITDNWSHVQVTKSIIDNRIHYSNKGIPVLIPLYLYPKTSNQQILGGEQERKPNLNLKIVKQIANHLKLCFTTEKENRDDAFAPIDLLDYIYAVLHSPAYREIYKEFLKIDFPRIPYPSNQETFWQLVKLGRELRQLHLLESPKVEQFITTYPQNGDNNVTRKITKKDYQQQEGAQTGKVWINDQQYFDHVPHVAWELYIGGYQPAQKWLKDRQGRTLEFDDILHYQKMIVALTETDRLMQEIDQIDFLD